MSAADTSVLVRAVIAAVGVEHGFRTSFSPKVAVPGVGNGGHVHLSLWRDGANLMAGGPDARFGLTADGEAFAAGILEHLPALMAVGAPGVTSYLRQVPSHWAGTYACWGLENREAAVRMVTGSPGATASAANVEVKCFDLHANPYLVFAGLIAAGLAGLSSSASLPDPVDVDPAVLGDDELASRGIRRLPQYLREAVDAFAADSVVHRPSAGRCRRRSSPSASPSWSCSTASPTRPSPPRPAGTADESRWVRPLASAMMTTVDTRGRFLAAYDEQLRTDAETPSAIAVTVLGPLAAGDLRRRARLRHLPRSRRSQCRWHRSPCRGSARAFQADPEITRVEWKTRAHDRAPGLHECLVAHGFVAEETESIMIGEAQRLAVDVPLPDGVTLRHLSAPSDVRAISAMSDAAFGEDPADSAETADALLRRLAHDDGMELWVAEVDGQVVSAARLEPVRGPTSPASGEGRPSRSSAAAASIEP